MEFEEFEILKCIGKVNEIAIENGKTIDIDYYLFESTIYKSEDEAKKEYEIYSRTIRLAEARRERFESLGICRKNVFFEVKKVHESQIKMRSEYMDTLDYDETIEKYLSARGYEIVDTIELNKNNAPKI